LGLNLVDVWARGKLHHKFEVASFNGCRNEYAVSLH